MAIKSEEDITLEIEFLLKAAECDLIDFKHREKLRDAVKVLEWVLGQYDSEKMYNNLYYDKVYYK
jgi:hypothetical protein